MAGANWQCAACDVFNGPSEKVCRACDTERAALNSKKPSPARPSRNWTCIPCGTNNDPGDLRCIGCETGWRAATKKAAAPRKTTAPKKPAPRRPTAKKPVTAGTSAKKTTAPRKTTTKKTAAPPASSHREVPKEVFYPSTSGGYTPATVTPASPPPAPAPAPPYTPVYRPAPYRNPKRSTSSKGCGWGCLAVVVVLFVVPSAFGKFSSLLHTDSKDSGPGGPSSTAVSCPGRIADAIPSGNGAKLVTAFRTKNKQITLCRTSGGNLYYFGEFSNHQEPGIAMPAKETSDGYEAHNGPYSYRITKGIVRIYENGHQIGRESLSPEPSPS